MELNQLRIFVAVCETKNVTRAASRLYMTPPSVSAQIKALETELNVALFIRTSKGMELTGEGRLLQTKAEETLRAAQQLIDQAVELQGRPVGPVTIGLNASPEFLRIGSLTRYLGEVQPGVALAFVNSVSGRIIAGLRNRSLDVGYVFGPVADRTLTTQHLGSADLVIAAPVGWADRFCQADWADLARLPWIDSGDDCPFQRLTHQLFQEKGLNYRRVTQADDERTKCELVSAGVGLALLEASEARQAAEAGRLVMWPGEPILCDLSFAWLTERRGEPALNAVAEALGMIWQEAERHYSSSQYSG